MEVPMSPQFTPPSHANLKYKGSNHQTWCFTRLCLSELVNQIFDYHGTAICYNYHVMHEYLFDDFYSLNVFFVSFFLLAKICFGDEDFMLLTSLLSYVSSALSNFSIVFGYHSSKFNFNVICLSIVILSWSTGHSLHSCSKQDQLKFLKWKVEWDFVFSQS